jgi:hypothetical protein
VNRKIVRTVALWFWALVLHLAYSRSKSGVRYRIVSTAVLMVLFYASGRGVGLDIGWSTVLASFSPFAGMYLLFKCVIPAFRIAGTNFSRVF